MQNDFFGENEISGGSLVQIAMAPGLTNVTFQMNSVTTAPGFSFASPEAWEVWGSNSATSVGAPILLGNDELSHSLPSFDFYTFAAQNFAPLSGNVLVSSITASPVPIPGALPGMVSVLMGSGFLAWSKAASENRLNI